MKETNVWLSPEELQHMFKGSLQWIDVSSRVAISETGIQKLAEPILVKQSALQQAVLPVYYPSEKMDKPGKRLVGQPVIWLLGSVGLLTLSSWFYYVIFAV